MKDSDLKMKLSLPEKPDKNVYNLHDKINQLEKELIQVKYEKEKEKVKILEDIIKNSNKTTQDIIKNSNKTTGEALKITSKTISALKYANDNFKDAPPLSPLSNFNMMGYDLEDEEDKKKLIEDLLFYYRKNSIHTVFGKHIISEYKKDNIKEQSMHATDTSRLNYIIKAGSNNQTKWHQDKNGIFVCSNLIDKLINHHVEILKWYNQILTEEMGQDPGRPQPNLQKKIESISKLLGDIESGQIIKETNKFIAPFFNLEK